MESSRDGNSVENGSSDVPYESDAAGTANDSERDSDAVATCTPDGSTALTWFETCVQKSAGHAGAAAKPIKVAAKAAMPKRIGRNAVFLN